MHVASLYTLYGRRAGAELYFEKILEEFSITMPTEIFFTVFCNKAAYEVLTEAKYVNVQPVYVRWLDNQYRKALWLALLSHKTIKDYTLDCFWIPSGTNHFPGCWKIPTVVTFHDFGEYHIPGKYGMVRTLYRKWLCVGTSIRRGSVFTSVSNTTAADLRKFWNVESRVVYSGSSPHLLTEPMTQQAAVDIVKRECGIVLPSKFFFTPGRTDYVGKGLDILSDAVEELQVWSILCGPPGEGHAQLLERISHSNGKMIYLGRVSNQVLHALYLLCEAVIFPSRFEGFGFPVLEAFHNKRAIIVSDGGALPEVCGDGGLIFSSGNRDQLIMRIKEFESMDAVSKQNMIDKGVARVNDFKWDCTVNQMYSQFENAVLKRNG